MLGAITLFASALLTAGVGPWLPFQMLGAAWFAYCAGCLPPMKGKAELWMLAAYGAIGSLAYGLILDLWFWPFGTEGASNITYVPGDSVIDNLRRFMAFHLATAMGWDAIRAGTTAALVLVLGRPALASLRRAHRLAAFDATPAFEPVARLSGRGCAARRRDGWSRCRRLPTPPAARSTPARRRSTR